MSLLTNKRTLLAEIESVYGTDPTPTGSANAMLVQNLTVTPIEAETVDRALIRPYFGNSEKLMAQKFSRAEFEIEAAAHADAVIGKIPHYDCLLRACGFAGAAVTTAMTSAAISSEVVTVTKTGHGLITGNKIITSGFTDTACNKPDGVAITRLNDNSFTFPAAGAVDDVAADGTPVYRTSYKYLPVSSSVESVTLYYNVDGVLHKLTGAIGSVEFDLAVKQIPKFKFNFTGIYNDPSDSAAPSITVSAFAIPKVANTQNTPVFSLAGYSALAESMNLNMANTVEYITLIGSESVKLLGRAPAGSMVIEAPTIASKDFFTLAKDQTSSEMILTHGPTNGSKVRLTAPSVLIEQPAYQDSNGIQMLSIPFTVNPVSGNDEVSIEFL